MKTENNSKALTGLGVFAALAASLCCITPVMALLAGASGAASAFSWLDPARPYLIGLAVVALSYAWYKSFSTGHNVECEPDGVCKIENKSFLASRTFLTFITILAIGLMAFPYYSKIFYPQPEKQTVIVSSKKLQQVSYKVSGMTCASCEETIKHSVNLLPGVVETKADYDSGTASIKYDPSKIDKNAIIKAINATGCSFCIGYQS
ncbi:mercuric transport protein MerTP [Daejeonella sp.]|uniref:mercuric transport protein MerTP n=1 Tax=Daejeonella sp. TaxID=2805397 RepID=UPI0027316EB5|nr:mercuric transport protein MerTP [Daejeonella sp.]MDP2412728.1 mercuric transport protein MerTP [Daejeonella sp.]